MMPTRGKIKRAAVTLYKNNNDMKTALLSAIELLKDVSESSGELKGKADEEGFVNIQDMCSILKEKHPELDYITHNHIVELFFKDRDRKLLINSKDQIKYKVVKYVQPPDTLYFGTLKNLADRMRTSGIRSNTKKYIKLYDTPELAKEFASKFALDPNDEVVVMSIDAMQAFTDGMKFSTYKPNEYIIVRIDRKYIKEEG